MVIVDINQMLKDNGCQYWILKSEKTQKGTHVLLIKSSDIKKINVSAGSFSIEGAIPVKKWVNEKCTFTDYSYGGILGVHENTVDSDSFTNHPQILEILTKKYPKKKHGSDFVEGLKFFTNNSCDIVPPIPPTPGGGGESGETDKPCSNTGQFGGGGTRLQDIKLFLYANKVTKGAIKLSKPQVEVGTYATDWRPNPADATKSIEMMLKQIESERKGGRKNGKKRD